MESAPKDLMTGKKPFAGLSLIKSLHNKLEQLENLTFSEKTNGVNFGKIISIATYLDIELGYELAKESTASQPQKNSLGENILNKAFDSINEAHEKVTASQPQKNQSFCPDCQHHLCDSCADKNRKERLTPSPELPKDKEPGQSSSDQFEELLGLVLGEGLKLRRNLKQFVNLPDSSLENIDKNQLELLVGLVERSNLVFESILQNTRQSPDTGQTACKTSQESLGKV